MNQSMTREQVLLRITTVLHETFGIDPVLVNPDARLAEDLDIDSIDAVDLLVQLRSLTGKRLQPEVFKSVRTVSDVVDALLVHLGEA